MNTHTSILLFILGLLLAPGEVLAQNEETYGAFRVRIEALPSPQGLESAIRLGMPIIREMQNALNSDELTDAEVSALALRLGTQLQIAEGLQRILRGVAFLEEDDLAYVREQGWPDLEAAVGYRLITEEQKRFLLGQFLASVHEATRRFSVTNNLSSMIQLQTPTEFFNRRLAYSDNLGTDVPALPLLPTLSPFEELNLQIDSVLASLSWTGLLQRYTNLLLDIAQARDRREITIQQMQSLLARLPAEAVAADFLADEVDENGRPFTPTSADFQTLPPNPNSELENAMNLTRTLLAASALAAAGALPPSLYAGGDVNALAAQTAFPSNCADEAPEVAESALGVVIARIRDSIASTEPGKNTGDSFNNADWPLADIEDDRGYLTDEEAVMLRLEIGIQVRIFDNLRTDAQRVNDIDEDLDKIDPSNGVRKNIERAYECGLITGEQRDWLIAELEEGPACAPESYVELDVDLDQDLEFYVDLEAGEGGLIACPKNQAPAVEEFEMVTLSGGGDSVIESLRDDEIGPRVVTPQMARILAHLAERVDNATPLLPLSLETTQHETPAVTLEALTQSYQAAQAAGSAPATGELEETADCLQNSNPDLADVLRSLAQVNALAAPSAEAPKTQPAPASASLFTRFWNALPSLWRRGSAQPAPAVAPAPVADLAAQVPVTANMQAEVAQFAELTLTENAEDAAVQEEAPAIKQEAPEAIDDPAAIAQDQPTPAAIEEPAGNTEEPVGAMEQPVDNCWWITRQTGAAIEGVVGWFRRAPVQPETQAQALPAEGPQTAQEAQARVVIEVAQPAPELDVPVAAPTGEEVPALPTTGEIAMMLGIGDTARPPSTLEGPGAPAPASASDL